MLRTILLMTRGIILDPRTRRWAMFILLLAALLMLFAGSTFLSVGLHPLLGRLRLAHPGRAPARPLGSPPRPRRRPPRAPEARGAIPRRAPTP